ncbi:hypothetical protein BVU76_11965 [Mycolicibacterium porcinum]|nr:hypothetical protein BVU76_11965 [Mycolicibacterium porcinum]
MTYPNPYHPQQPPLPGSYPPAQPGPYGYGYPPAQPYGAQPQLPYYPPPAATPPKPKRSNGDSWGWQLLAALVFFSGDSTGHGLGNDARERAKTGLMLWGLSILVIAIVVAIAVLMSK